MKNQPHYPDELRPLINHELLSREEELVMTRAIAEGNLAREVLKENRNLKDEAREILRQKNVEAEAFRQKLPFFYVRSMIKICDKFWYQLIGYCSYMDLFDEAFLVTQDFILRIGLEGKSNFDPERGVRMLTFLWPKIHCEIRNYSRKNGNTELIHMTADAKKKYGFKNVLFASTLIEDGCGNEGSLRIFTSEETSVPELIGEFEELDIVRDAIEKCGLNPREKEILERNQGLNGRNKEALNDIRKNFRLTKQRIGQIRNKARSKLREYLIRTHPQFKVLAELQLAKNTDSVED